MKSYDQKDGIVDAASSSLRMHDAPLNATIINQQTAVTIGGGAAGDTKLLSINVTKALTGTIVITGFADQAGAAQSITYPAATAINTYWFNTVNKAGALTVTCSNAGDTKNVIINWLAV